MMGIARSLRSLQTDLHNARRLRVKSDGLVLDVGSGQNPNLRANVLCDKFVVDHSERACQGPVILDDRPFVIGDAMTLPFKDRAFDYVVCSHVIEHVPDPGRLLQEMQRVANAGYIEAPSRLYEKLFGLAMHKWYVSQNQDTLVLECKRTASPDPELNHAMQELMQEDASFTRFITGNLDRMKFLVRFFWEDQINYQIIDGSTIPKDQSFRFAQYTKETQDVIAAPASLSWKRRIKNRIGRTLRRDSDRCLPPLTELIACPVCHSDLETNRDGSKLRCVKCDTAYPVWKGIPMLVQEALEPSVRPVDRNGNSSHDTRHRRHSNA